MKTENEKKTFAQLIDSFRFRYDLSRVFDDFLTITICASSRDFSTGLSRYEDLYLQSIERYKGDELRHQFPKMLDALIAEMDDLVRKEECSDVLGNFYETFLSKKYPSGQVHIVHERIFAEF